MDLKLWQTQRNNLVLEMKRMLKDHQTALAEVAQQRDMLKLELWHTKRLRVAAYRRLLRKYNASVASPALHSRAKSGRP